MKHLWFCILSTVAVAAESPWRNTWVYGDSPDSSQLVIKSVTEKGFDFEISASSGANVGELSGKATIDGKTAKALVEKCRVTFVLDGQKLSVTTEDCNDSAPAGVDFDGTYRPDSVPPSYAASFDCAKAQTAVEKKICGNPWLAAADQELGTAFAAASLAAKADAKAKLKTAQRAWVTERDKACEKSEVIHCLADRYLKRIAELRGLVKKRSPRTLAIEDYLKDTYDASRDALWQDPLMKLLVFRKLGQDRTEHFFAHTIYFSESAGKPKEGISILSQIRGIPQSAATVLTRNGDLWIAYQTVKAGKWEPQVFGPKDSKTLPLALRDWLAEAKNSGTLPPKIEYVF